MSGSRCPVAITLDDAPAALAAARQAMRGSGGRLDLSGLERFDSAAVAVLVALRREWGPSAAFLSPPANLRKLASLYGVAALLFDPVG